MDDSHTGLSNFIWIFFLLTYWKMPFGVFPFDKKKKKTMWTIQMQISVCDIFRFVSKHFTISFSKKIEC